MDIWVWALLCICMYVFIPGCASGECVMVFWANDSIPAKLVKKRWRAATAFQWKKPSEMVHWLSIHTGTRQCVHTPQHFDPAWLCLIFAFSCQHSRGFGLTVHGLAEHHQSISLMTGGYHSTLSVMFVPGIALNVFWTDLTCSELTWTMLEVKMNEKDIAEV